MCRVPPLEYVDEIEKERASKTLARREDYKHQPTDRASYVPPPEKVPEVKKVRAVRKSQKKTKEPVA